jgi:hypothetical protein
MGVMLGFSASITKGLDVGVQPLKSRRAMLDTLVRHLAMVRLSLITCAAIALFGCTGLIASSNGGENLTPQQQLAEQKWTNEALPAIRHATCDGCHAGSTAGVGFLVGMTDLDIRKTLMGFDPPVINLDAPPSSRILTKGAHNGPALQADDASAILDWVQAEQAAASSSAGSGSGTMLISTPLFTPQICTSGVAGDPTCPINHVPLDMAGLAGAEVRLLVQALDNNDIYVTDLYLAAAGQGAYIEHPMFVSYPTAAGAMPIPDSIDRFFDVKMNLPMGTAPATCPSPSCATISGGTAAFIGFPPNNQLAIHFKVVSPYQATSGTGSTGGGGGCKVVSSFITNAKPLMIAANSCSSCHMGQNANATSAMNITGINTTDMTMLTNACNQVRTRVNFQTIPQSGVLLAPDPAGDGAHPFKLSTASNPTLANFQTGLTTWINDEKAAP